MLTATNDHTPPRRRERGPTVGRLKYEWITTVERAALMLAPMVGDWDGGTPGITRARLLKVYAPLIDIIERRRNPKMDLVLGRAS